MKKLSLFIFLVSLISRAQYVPTSNIGLQIPSNGSNNWNLPLNFNFNRLDLLLSGNAAIPGLNVNGNVVVSGSITAGSFTGVSGGTFPTLSGNPLSGQCAYFVTSSSLGGETCGSGSGAGVTSLNTQTGPQSIIGDSTIQISPNGTNQVLLHVLGVLPYCAGATCANQYNFNFTVNTPLTPSAAINNTQTSFSFSSTTGYPSVGCGSWNNTIEVDCWTGNSGNTLTGITAIYGTTRKAHSINDGMSGIVSSQSNSLTSTAQQIQFNTPNVSVGTNQFNAGFQVGLGAVFASGLTSPNMPINSIGFVAGSYTVNPILGLCGPQWAVQSSSEVDWLNGTPGSGCSQMIKASITANGAATFQSAVVGGSSVCTTGNACPGSHSDYWTIQPSLFSTSTVLSAIFFEPFTLPVSSLVARVSGSIGCSVAPSISIMDLGTSPSTTYGSATTFLNWSTGTSDGVYPYALSGIITTPSVSAGHYYGVAFSAGTCATAPTFDITMNL